MSPRPETITAKNQEHAVFKAALNEMGRRLAKLSREKINGLQINYLIVDIDGEDVCVHPAHKDQVNNQLSTWVPGGSMVVSQIEPDGSVNIRWGKGFAPQNYPPIDQAEEIWDPGIVRLSLLSDEHALDLADADSDPDVMNKNLSKWNSVITWIETGLEQSGYKKKETI